MAMAAVALSSFMWKIDRLLGMLSSSGLSSSESVPVLEAALNDLSSILPKLQSALANIASVVEEEELPETVLHDAAGEWMHKVKTAAYDAEDVLDDCELHQDATARQPPAVDDSVASAAAGTSPVVLLQISDIRQRFEGIMTEHDQALNLHRLGVIGVRLPSPAIVLSPAPPPPDRIRHAVYGRDDDKEKLVQLLLSSSPSQQRQHGRDQHPPVVAVVGEEGVGKTTLCRLVYTDPRICEHFDVRIWACFSQQCLTMDDIRGYSYYREVGFLAHLLQWDLTHNRFLLVVDDMERDDLGFWEIVYKNFGAASWGSQVLLTSRTEEHLAKIMAAGMPTYHGLGCLTEESSWSVFKDYAFRGRDPPEVPPSLEAIGRQICRKCRGSPLLLKMMGALLHSDAASEEEQYWEVVLRSRCWRSKHRAMQAVPGFCFRRLPSHLRRCLVYCSLFSKRYPFTIDQLVRLWMAQDFLPPAEEGKQMEDVGNGVIDRLLWFSFLAQPPIGEQTLVMPGPVHDLARSHLASTECSKKGDVEEISMDARHSSLLPRSPCNGEIQLPSTYPKPARLKSCLLVRSWGHEGDGFYFSDEDVLRLRIPGDFFLPLGHLSSLDLSYSNVKELPESVGTLRHLRYLSLNHTCIRELPESMSALHSLWTLELRSCRQLRAVPRGLNKLTGLRHLDLLNIRRAWFPLSDIRELTNLRTLTSFTVGRGRGRSTSTIDQLKHLGGLRGELQIIGLRNVLFAQEAAEAELGNKEHLEKLTVHWLPASFSSDESRCRHDHEEEEIADAEEDGNTSEEEVLALLDGVQIERKESAVARRERLLLEANRWFREAVFESFRPHPNLRHLVVEGYDGERLPGWMGDPSFSMLVSLTLTWCGKCRALPPGLGRLPSLKQLTIKSFGGTAWRTQDGSDPEPIILKGFSSLEELEVEDMPWWEKWCGPEEEEEDGDAGGIPLCRLRCLTVVRCSRLKRLPRCLPSLTRLEIRSCEQLTGFPAAPSLISLFMAFNLCSEGKLCVSWLGGLTALKSLTVCWAGDLTDPPLPKLSTLRRLVISSCGRISCRRPPSPLGLHGFLGLRHLEISFCGELCFLPEERLPSKLEVLIVEACPLLRDWCLQQRSKLAAAPWVRLDGVSYEQVIQDADVATGMT